MTPLVLTPPVSFREAQRDRTELPGIEDVSRTARLRTCEAATEANGTTTRGHLRVPDQRAGNTRAWCSYCLGYARNINIHTCVHLSIYLSIYLSLHIYIYIYIIRERDVYIHTCMLYVYICMYVYIYIYIYIVIFVYKSLGQSETFGQASRVSAHKFRSVVLNPFATEFLLRSSCHVIWLTVHELTLSPS